MRCDYEFSNVRPNWASTPVVCILHLATQDVEVFTVFNEQISIYVLHSFAMPAKSLPTSVSSITDAVRKIKFYFHPTTHKMRTFFRQLYIRHAISGKFTELRVENRLPFDLCHVPVQTIDFRNCQRSDPNGTSSIFYHRITSPDSGVSSCRIVTNS